MRFEIELRFGAIVGLLPATLDMSIIMPLVDDRKSETRIDHGDAVTQTIGHERTVIAAATDH